MNMPVSLGRIVRYFDGHDEFPAMVVQVVEETQAVNLVYWDQFGTSHAVLDAHHSERPKTERKTWFWPPAVSPAKMKQFADEFFAKQNKITAEMSKDKKP